MSIGHFTSCGNIVAHLNETYPDQWQQAPETEGFLVDIQLLVMTFRGPQRSTLRRIVGERSVEPILGEDLVGNIQEMLSSTMRRARGVRSADILFLSTSIATFATDILLSGLIQRRANSCTLDVKLFVHEWMKNELPIPEQDWPSEPELGDGVGYGGVPASNEAIEAVRTTTYGSATAEGGDGVMVREATCIVCMEDFVAGQELRVMPCAHAFHKPCLDLWLKMNHVCPLCRFCIGAEEEAAQTSHAATATSPLMPLYEVYANLIFIALLGLGWWLRS